MDLFSWFSSDNDKEGEKFDEFYYYYKNSTLLDKLKSSFNSSQDRNCSNPEFSTADRQVCKYLSSERIDFIICLSLIAILLVVILLLSIFLSRNKHISKTGDDLAVELMFFINNRDG